MLSSTIFSWRLLHLYYGIVCNGIRLKANCEYIQNSVTYNYVAAIFGLIFFAIIYYNDQSKDTILVIHQLRLSISSHQAVTKNLKVVEKKVLLTIIPLCNILDFPGLLSQ